MKPLVVGLAPSRLLDVDEPPLVNSPSGARLAALCHLGSARELLDIMDLVNLFDEPVPQTLDGELQAEARLSAAAIEVSVAQGRNVVCLGFEVARAFRIHKAPMYKWQRGAFNIARAPHPSGRAYYWNDPANVERAETFWYGLLHV